MDKSEHGYNVTGKPRKRRRVMTERNKKGEDRRVEKQRRVERDQNTSTKKQ